MWQPEPTPRQSENPGLNPVSSFPDTWPKARNPSATCSWDSQSTAWRQRATGSQSPQQRGPGLHCLLLGVWCLRRGQLHYGVSEVGSAALWDAPGGLSCIMGCWRQGQLHCGVPKEGISCIVGCSRWAWLHYKVPYKAQRGQE